MLDINVAPITRRLYCVQGIHTTFYSNNMTHCYVHLPYLYWPNNLFCPQSVTCTTQREAVK